MQPTDHEVCEEMQRTGGGYVQRLALTYLLADNENRELLRPAFERYRAEYAERVEARKNPDPQGNHHRLQRANGH